MIYFDSDVLVHYFVEQDTAKNLQAIRLYQQASVSNAFVCSLLTLQETSYVLAKLKVPSEEISVIVDNLLEGAIQPRIAHFKRACELAREIGFKNINDCLHAAIAEDYCSELLTYNASDFKRIQDHTKLKITTL